MPKPKIYTRLIALAAAAALVGIDQLIKQWMTAALVNSPEGPSRTLVPGVVGLLYTRNTGISFSFFGDAPAAMTAISILVALVMLAGIIALLSGKIGGVAPLCSAALILAGGLGNLIDRLLGGFVVDYIELLFVKFAIFNFADIYITCGVILMTAWVIWGEVRRHKAKVKA